MRSSIACARCRRSKIKCVNTGTDSTCKACASTGRECTYPPPAPGSSSTLKRVDAPGGLKLEGEGDVKRVRRRETDSARRGTLRHNEDELESPPISEKLWQDIYNLFRLHCYTELPFLHGPTFFQLVEKPPSERTADEKFFLLGVLTLTARFVPELVAYHDRDRRDPLAASEFYADAFNDRLNAAALLGPSSLERIQGLLMVCLYHWGMCRGKQSWMYITVVRGQAQILDLSSEESPPSTDKPNSPALDKEAQRLGLRPQFLPSPIIDPSTSIEREIKRRTTFSLFILDRYLASGRSRQQMFPIDHLHVQLPCSEEDFHFGTNVRTEYLRAPDPAAKGNRQGDYGLEADKGQVLSRYIRLVEMWGRFSRWSCEGGRRQERYPPWDKRSTFFELRRQLDAFHESLTPRLTFSPSNIKAQMEGKVLTIYTAIHTLYSLCRIVLHREYIPFLPLRCDRPSGPLDEPTFPKEKYNVPDGFWEESAEHIFKAARDIMEIVRATAKRGMLVESPQVGFAVWTAAFVGVYANNFQHMDTAGYMCDKPFNNGYADHGDNPNGATGLALKTLKQMRPRMAMAIGWTKWIDRMHHYFVDMRHDYHNSIQSLGNRLPYHDTRKLSLREGGQGGGLEEYKLLEKELNDFGPRLNEEDRFSTPGLSESNDRPASRASTTTSALTPDVRSETMQGAERSTMPNRTSTDSSPWAAVNKDNNGSNNQGAESYQRSSAQSSQSNNGYSQQSGANTGSYYHGTSSNSSNQVSPSTMQPNGGNHNASFNRNTNHEGYRIGSQSQQIPSFSTAQHSATHAIIPHSHISLQPTAQHSWRADPNRSAKENQDSFLESIQPVENMSFSTDIVGFSHGQDFDEWGPTAYDIIPDGDASGLLHAGWVGAPLEPHMSWAG